MSHATLINQTATFGFQDEEAYFMERMALAGIEPMPKIINNDTPAAERHKTYLEGGERPEKMTRGVHLKHASSPLHHAPQTLFVECSCFL